MFTQNDHNSFKAKREKITKKFITAAQDPDLVNKEIKTSVRDKRLEIAEHLKSVEAAESDIVMLNKEGQSVINISSNIKALMSGKVLVSKEQ